MSLRAGRHGAACGHCCPCAVAAANCARRCREATLQLSTRRRPLPASRKGAGSPPWLPVDSTAQALRALAALGRRPAGPPAAVHLAGSYRLGCSCCSTVCCSSSTAPSSTELCTGWLAVQEAHSTAPQRPITAHRTRGLRPTAATATITAGTQHPPSSQSSAPPPGTRARCGP